MTPHEPTPRDQELGRHRVIGLVELNVAIAMHLASSFREAWKQRIWQCQEHRLLKCEQCPHLLAHGTVDARVGDLALPIGEVQVLICERGERPPLQGVVLRVFYARLNLPLVVLVVPAAWAARWCRSGEQSPPSSR